MPYPTLQDFLADLESKDQLRRVSEKVSPILEIAEIADRVSKSDTPAPSKHAQRTDPRHAHLGGRGLLFDSVEGSSIPLTINAYGSYRRVEMALGCEAGGFGELAERIGEVIKPEPPLGLVGKVKKGLELVKLASYAPKIGKGGICQEIVKTGSDIDLFCPRP